MCCRRRGGGARAYLGVLRATVAVLGGVRGDGRKAAGGRGARLPRARGHWLLFIVRLDSPNSRSGVAQFLGPPLS